MEFRLSSCLYIFNILQCENTIIYIIIVLILKHKKMFKHLNHTKLKVTTIDEKDRELKGISLRGKSWHSDDSGPGEKWGVFNLAKKIM